MGGSNSRDDSWRRSNSSSSWGYPQSGYPQSSFPEDSYSQSSYSQDSYNYPSRPTVPAYGPPQTSSTPSQHYGGGGHSRPELGQRKLDRRYSRIADNYNSLDEVYSSYAPSLSLCYHNWKPLIFGFYGNPLYWTLGRSNLSITLTFSEISKESFYFYFLKFICMLFHTLSNC